MPTNLPRLLSATDPNDRVLVQDTEFTQDVLGRFVCNTWDEATQNGGVEFDVIGGGMFGALCGAASLRTRSIVAAARCWPMKVRSGRRPNN
jgi:hypothetical protein